MAKEKVAKALQQGLVDLIELSLQSKQAHWNIQGKGFQSLHEHLDQITDAARTAFDEFAERLAALDLPSDGRAQTIAETTTLKPIQGGVIEVAEAYKVIEEALLQVSETIKKNLADVDDEDPLTGDLLISTARDLEKSAWMLRMQSK